MSAPQTLIQAAVNRLAARLGSGLADAAAGLAVIAQDAPERLLQEWQLFVEEVEQEAERLEQPSADASAEAAASWAAAGPEGPGGAHGADPHGAAAGVSPQDQIDQLRALVAQLSRRLEDRA